MYEIIIGLEVHTQLATRSKAFCGCSTRFGAAANSQACPVCLGLPGTLPVLNRQAWEYALMTALALNCQAREWTKFDRKNYFYPDLPKNYQISQYDCPLSQNGYLDIELGQGKQKRIGITRVHLEEDAGKLIHSQEDGCSYVDYNRAGVPLLEIVSCPDIRSPQEAYAYLTQLKAILSYLGVSDCDMEKGSLRCDANISLRRKGESKLGVKTELKNLNSFRSVKAALEFEAKRQRKIIDGGGDIAQQTLLWDEAGQRAVVMRSKEQAHDYRYFSEPDLAPFTLTPQEIKRIKDNLPELPQARKARMKEAYGLSDYDLGVLVSDKALSDYFEHCARQYRNYKKLANWISGAFIAELNTRKIKADEAKIAPGDFARLLQAVDGGRINNLGAKSALSEMFSSGKGPEEVIRAQGLQQVSDKAELERMAREAIEENPRPVADYRAGKENALMFLVGQIMRKSKGKANPQMARQILISRL
ncbi:MAG: Asp-tRNA(Asn)/Glu-tRNA(Gln) amidotransferase subunit GatB [Candidatus Omnitrophota bacterium]